MAETTTEKPALTEAEAMQVVDRGVSREIRTDSQRTLGYCGDAVKLQGHNVRKLAQKLEIRHEEKGEVFNADSYMSNISNANGIMALFGWDMDAFKEWLETSPTKSLSAIFKAFRELFAEKKPAKDKPAKTEGDGETVSGTPLEVVLSLLPHLSPEERLVVAEALIALDTAQADEAEAEEVPAAA